MTKNNPAAHPNPLNEGILLINKPRGKTSFSLVATLRRLLDVQKIGHAGTLDPFATGVMVLLVGRQYTQLSDQFLMHDKEYIAQLHLGIVTDTYDCEGKILQESTLIPSLQEIETVVEGFQGEILQVPPMFSAKKKEGKKLYELARQGKTIEREAVPVCLQIEIQHYLYPYLELKVACSKGTYIRSLGHDIGAALGCGAYVSQLERVRSGSFHIEDCFDGALLQSSAPDIPQLQARLRTKIDSKDGRCCINPDLTNV
jgi:tRNA pseudouridine55 synthase